MVLCLLVYCLAEHLLRFRLAATEQTVPNQVNKPTKRPTMRWIFQCFEGIDLLHIRIGSRGQTQVLGLQSLHHRILRLLGPAYSQFYFFLRKLRNVGSRRQLLINCLDFWYHHMNISLNSKDAK